MSVLCIVIVAIVVLIAVLLAMILALLFGRRRPPRGRPLPSGAVAPDVSVPEHQARTQYRAAFANAAGGSEAMADVMWVEGENELLVRAAQVRVVFRDGFVLVGIPVYTEQSGDVEVVVPFAMGRPGAPLGLVMATETVPRGPASIVEPWGDQLLAAAWSALVRLTTGVAATAGVDARNAPLVPASIVAHAGGLTITPQARHVFDEVVP